MTIEQTVIALLSGAIAKLWYWALSLQAENKKCMEALSESKVSIAKLETQVGILTRTHMFVIVDYNGKIIHCGGNVNQLVGVSSPELINYHVKDLIEDSKLKDRHIDIFNNLDQNKTLREQAVTGKLHRWDGGQSIEVVVKLKEINFRGQKCISGYIFEVPSINKV